MKLSIVSVLALASASVHASHYEVYMTACGGSRCPQTIPSQDTKVGLPPPPLPLYLSKVTFSSDHKVLKKENLTSVQKGMGYIDVDAKQERALFSTQGTNRLVDINVIDLNGSANAPRLLIGDRSGLLAPCVNATPHAGTEGCTGISVFSGQWSGDEVLFSFEAWTKLGDLAMAQGLGVARADGTGARILTHDASVCPYVKCDGSHPPEVAFTDTCPKPLPGDRVLFTRSFGSRTNLAVLDRASGNVTVLDKVPIVAPVSGCPSVDARGEKVLYMSCSPADQCEQGDGTNTYGVVDLSNPSVFVPGFEVPDVDAPNFKGTPSTSNCAYDSQDDSGAETFSCLGANTQHNSVVKFGVDQKTGVPDAEDDHTAPMCMTAACYKTFVVAGDGREVGNVVVV